jgi:hypothetical protein
VVTALVLASLCLPRPAPAFTIGFVPASQTVSLGDPVSVQIVVSGLHDAEPDEIVSGFDLDILYDSAILAALGVSFGAELGGPLDSFQDFDLSLAGTIDLAEFSFLDDATLDGLQADSVVLATLSFTATGLDTSALLIVQDGDFVLTGRADGGGIPQPLVPLSVQSGSITAARAGAPGARRLAEECAVSDAVLAGGQPARRSPVSIGRRSWQRSCAFRS